MTTFKYLLETSTCIELLRGNEHVRQKCVEHNQVCCISAREGALIVVTHNLKHFNRIEGLTAEDWTV